jgi:predicted RNA-binding Zn ribbon-like protein
VSIVEGRYEAPSRARITVISKYCRLGVTTQGAPRRAAAPRSAAQGEERDGFWFLANNVVLDLLNTEMMEGGRLTDRLLTPADLGRWVVTAGLSEDARPPAIQQSVFAKVIELRRALRAGFDRFVSSEPFPDAAVQRVNAILLAGMGPSSTLHREGESLVRYPEANLSARPELVVWLLADAAADLLSVPEMGRVHRCADGACVLYFVDTSRNHSRRWCSMELCGNRNKVANHYQRARADSEGKPKTG